MMSGREKLTGLVVVLPSRNSQEILSAKGFERIDGI